MVEVDGRVVYDSEENDIDRMSLEAIRVIPPAHVDAAGKVVQNAPNPRETFIWEAGKAMGLDLAPGTYPYKLTAAARPPAISCFSGRRRTRPTRGSTSLSV